MDYTKPSKPIKYVDYDLYSPNFCANKVRFDAENLVFYKDPNETGKLYCFSLEELQEMKSANNYINPHTRRELTQPFINYIDVVLTEQDFPEQVANVVLPEDTLPAESEQEMLDGFQEVMLADIETRIENLKRQRALDRQSPISQIRAELSDLDIDELSDEKEEKDDDEYMSEEKEDDEYMSEEKEDDEYMSEEKEDDDYMSEEKEEVLSSDEEILSDSDVLPNKFSFNTVKRNIKDHKYEIIDAGNKGEKILGSNWEKFIK